MQACARDSHASLQGVNKTRTAAMAEQAARANMAEAAANKAEAAAARAEASAIRAQAATSFPETSSTSARLGG